jgi:hypothetical protein
MLNPSLEEYMAIEGGAASKGRIGASSDRAVQDHSRFKINCPPSPGAAMLNLCRYMSVLQACTDILPFAEPSKLFGKNWCIVEIWGLAPRGVHWRFSFWLKGSWLSGPVRSHSGPVKSMALFDERMLRHPKNIAFNRPGYIVSWQIN